MIYIPWAIVCFVVYLIANHSGDEFAAWLAIKVFLAGGAVILLIWFSAPVGPPIPLRQHDASVATDSTGRQHVFVWSGELKRFTEVTSETVKITYDAPRGKRVATEYCAPTAGWAKVVFTGFPSKQGVYPDTVQLLPADNPRRIPRQ